MLLWLYTHVFKSTSVSPVFRRMLQVFYLDVSYVGNGYIASVYSECFICFRCTLQLFHLSVTKVKIRLYLWRKPKALVVQQLRLPAVVKMEAANTRAAGMGCRGRSTGMGAGTVHRVGWDVGLHHSTCVWRRRGKVGPNDCCLRSGDERGAWVGVRWAPVSMRCVRAWEQHPSGHPGASCSVF
jgi:hypothetical protein